MDKAKRLIIVAAPSCCGKSTFAEQFINGDLPKIAKSIDVDNATSLIYKDIWWHEKELKTLTNTDNLEFILHYTLPHPALKFIFRRGYDKKLRLSILQASDNITFLTLFADPSTLVDRIQLRRARHYENRKKSNNRFQSASALRTLKRLDRIYSNPNKLIDLYQKWFDVCSEFNAHAHYLINVENTPELITLSKWPDISHAWATNSSTKQI